MAYTSWSVVFGEQPSAAKWNILGTNDASFNDGSGLPTGVTVQQVGTAYSAVATGTTTIPNDDTIPQITEGVEFMTQAITPVAATNYLLISAVIQLSNSSAGNRYTTALFQDATADALAAVMEFDATTNAILSMKLQHRMLAGTTSSTTFRIRAGGSSAGTMTFNGTGGARFLGAIPKSMISIVEYKAS